MPKKSTVDPQDIAAFKEAVKGTKPLSGQKVRVAKPSLPPTKPIKTPEPPKERFYFSDMDYLEPVSGDDAVTHVTNGISNKALRKLSKGQYNVEAILDLHGMTVEEAKSAVDSFLQQCLHDGLRVVLIIHGKGHLGRMPILKNKLNHWLRKIDEVLAFSSAAPGHGRGGAMYVLLKRVQEEKYVE